MTQSKSNGSLLKLVQPRIFGFFAIAALAVSLLLFVTVGIAEGYFSRQLCLGGDCWEEFRSIFSLPISILIGATELLVSYATVAGILVAVHTYLETKRVASSQVHLANKAGFESFVLGRLDRFKYLNRSIITVDIWYAAIYPASHRGDLSISEKYLRSLKEIQDFVRRTDGLITRAGRGYRHDRYHGPIIEMLRSFGINLSGTSRLEFFSLEREAYAIINDVNAVFCVESNWAELKISMAHGIP